MIYLISFACSKELIWLAIGSDVFLVWKRSLKILVTCRVHGLFTVEQ